VVCRAPLTREPFPVVGRALRLAESSADPEGLRVPGLLFYGRGEATAVQSEIMETAVALRSRTTGGLVVTTDPGVAACGAARTTRVVGFVVRRRTHLGRVHQVEKPAALWPWWVVLTDFPGSRAVMAARDSDRFGLVGLWSGDPLVVDEVRASLLDLAGVDAPRRAPAEWPETGALVRRKASALRAARPEAEAAMREKCRRAALRTQHRRRAARARSKAARASRA